MSADMLCQERIEAFIRKAKVMRQINSDKSHKYNRLHIGFNIATIVMSMILSFFGFLGTEKMQEYIGIFIDTGKITVELLNNIVILTILTITVIVLVYRFHDRHNSSFQAVKDLTKFINNAENTLIKLQCSCMDPIAGLDECSRAYDAVVANLPSNTDEEWRKAKARMDAK